MSEIRKYIARYGAMRVLGIFSFASEDALFHGTRVILRTSRGQEAGTVLCEATPEAVEALPPGMEEDRILRLMTPADEKEFRQIAVAEKDEFNRARTIIQRMNLVMDLVRVEHLFGGERLIIYYVAEGRIDFRDLVKALASEFQTRIEMRQIGVRDETKLLADIGDCGREVCCNSYLIAMPPVSMRMAKLQKATLDPTKISGRCGRLKCCLRYEFDVYAELQAALPSIGKMVETEDGIGKVLNQELLAKKVLVELEDRTRKYFSADDVKVVNYSRPPHSSEGENLPEKYPESEERLGERGEKTERPERGERSDRPERFERSGRGERRSGRKDSWGEKQPPEKDASERAVGERGGNREGNPSERSDRGERKPRFDGGKGRRFRDRNGNGPQSRENPRNNGGKERENGERRPASEERKPE